MLIKTNVHGLFVLVMKSSLSPGPEMTLRGAALSSQPTFSQIWYGLLTHFLLSCWGTDL